MLSCHRYLHIGCNPGGGAHGRSNTLGGKSPFYIMLRRGADLDDARTLADWIRGAAVLCRQTDIAHARRLARSIADNKRRRTSDTQTHATGSIASSMATLAAYHNTIMEHQLLLSQEDQMTTGDVMGGELLGLAQHKLMMESFEVVLKMGISGFATNLVAYGGLALAAAKELSDGGGLSEIFHILFGH
eukprot:COSAG02_NODE_7368_length_3045_cov_1.732519_3_plen_188_part_00